MKHPLGRDSYVNMYVDDVARSRSLAEDETDNVSFTIYFLLYYLHTSTLSRQPLPPTMGAHTRPTAPAALLGSNTAPPPPPPRPASSAPAGACVLRQGGRRVCMRPSQHTSLHSKPACSRRLCWRSAVLRSRQSRSSMLFSRLAITVYDTGGSSSRSFSSKAFLGSAHGTTAAGKASNTRAPSDWIRFAAVLWATGTR